MSNAVLSGEELDFIKQEEAILRSTIRMLKEKIINEESKFAEQNQKSRELTSLVVNTRRQEENIQNIHDESISYSFRNLSLETIKKIENNIKKPYFARIIVEEKNKNLEYKIGFLSDSDARIIDWKTSPLASLFYNYEENEEYFEVIQANERSGFVRKKIKLDIKEGVLRKIYLSNAVYELKNSVWIKAQGNSTDLNAKKENIFSEFTEEQFKLVTSSENLPTIISGIAGSGKTTVAVHRTLTLASKEQLEFPAVKQKVCFVTINPTLKNYIQDLITKSGFNEDIDITIHSYSTWIEKLITNIFSLTFENSSQTHKRIKQSKAFFLNFYKELEKIDFTGMDAISDITELRNFLGRIIFNTYSNYNQIIEVDGSKLLSKTDLIDCSNKFNSLINQGKIQYEDAPFWIALIRRALQNEFFLKKIKFSNSDSGPLHPFILYDYFVVDESQELSMIEMYQFLLSCKKIANVSFSCDFNQGVQSSNSIDEMKYVLSLLSGNKERKEKFVVNHFSISFRNTLEIVKLASYIKNLPLPSQGRNGRIPIWFISKNEQNALLNTIRWIEKAIEKYPNVLTAIICRDKAEVKYLYSLLEKKFGYLLRILDDKITNFTEGLVITSIENATGLEFLNVLLWNLSENNYNVSGQDITKLKAQIYIAITRAIENLCIITYTKPLHFLPTLSSKLVRIYEDEDESS